MEMMLDTDTWPVTPLGGAASRQSRVSPRSAVRSGLNPSRSSQSEVRKQVRAAVCQSPAQMAVSCVEV